MSVLGESYDKAGGVTPPATVVVWDPFVRLFHWSLVAAFGIAFISAEESDRLHEWAGYAAAALVATRIIWGLIGTRHARFSDFLRGPVATLSYFKDAIQGREKRFLGHNPLGAAMIVLLLVGILTLGITGYWMSVASHAEKGAIEEIHEIVGNGMLVLVALHVLGVIHAGLRHKENLVAAMISGKKRAE